MSGKDLKEIGGEKNHNQNTTYEKKVVFFQLKIVGVEGLLRNSQKS